jgi:hypothetical protein
MQAFINKKIEKKNVFVYLCNKIKNPSTYKSGNSFT